VNAKVFVPSAYINRRGNRGAKQIRCRRPSARRGDPRRPARQKRATKRKTLSSERSGELAAAVPSRRSTALPLSEPGPGQIIENGPFGGWEQAKLYPSQAFGCRAQSS